MNLELIVEATRRGYRFDRGASSVYGVERGITFDARFADGLRIGFDTDIRGRKLSAMSAKLAKEYPGSSVTADDSGIAVVFALPYTAKLNAMTFYPILDYAISLIVKYTRKTSDGERIRRREAWYVYLRGALGACLGAFFAIFPWNMAKSVGIAHFWLGALVFIAALSGYRVAKGAHSMRFLVSVTVIMSVIFIVKSEFYYLIRDLFPVMLQYGFSYARDKFGDADIVRYMLNSLINIGLGTFFGLAGLVLLRRYIIMYSKEPPFHRKHRIS